MSVLIFEGVVAKSNQSQKRLRMLVFEGGGGAGKEQLSKSNVREGESGGGKEQPAQKRAYTLIFKGGGWW